LVVAQSSSEVPEGLMNNPVLFYTRENSFDLGSGGTVGSQTDVLCPLPDVFKLEINWAEVQVCFVCTR